MGKLRSLDLSNKKSLVESKPRIMSAYDLSILNKIDEIYTDNPEYSYRYIHRQLLEQGFCVGRDRVLKYMGIMSIEAIYPRKKKAVIIKDDSNKIHKPLLDKYWTTLGKIRTVFVHNSEEVWSGDITYIRMHSGYIYIVATID